MPHDAKNDAQSIGGNVGLRREILGKRSKYDDLMDLAKKEDEENDLTYIYVSFGTSTQTYVFNF